MGAPRPLTGGLGGAGVGVIAGQITSRPPMLNIHPGQTRGGMPMTMTMPGTHHNTNTKTPSSHIIALSSCHHLSFPPSHCIICHPLLLIAFSALISFPPSLIIHCLPPPFSHKVSFIYYLSSPPPPLLLQRPQHLAFLPSPSTQHNMFS